MTTPTSLARADVRLWLASKLDQPWSSSKIAGFLTKEVLVDAKEKFSLLEPSVKLRLLFALAAVKKAQQAELHAEMAALLSLATTDSEEWVRVIASLLGSFTEGRIDSSSLDENTHFQAFQEAVLASLKSTKVNLAPLEEPYLFHTLESTPSTQHFTVVKKAPRLEALLGSANTGRVTLPSLQPSMLKEAATPVKKEVADPIARLFGTPRGARHSSASSALFAQSSRPSASTLRSEVQSKAQRGGVDTKWGGGVKLIDDSKEDFLERQMKLQDSLRKGGEEGKLTESGANVRKGGGWGPRRFVKVSEKTEGEPGVEKPKLKSAPKLKKANKEQTEAEEVIIEAKETQEAEPGQEEAPESAAKPDEAFATVTVTHATGDAKADRERAKEEERRLKKERKARRKQKEKEDRRLLKKLRAERKEMEKEAKRKERASDKKRKREEEGEDNAPKRARTTHHKVDSEAFDADLQSSSVSADKPRLVQKPTLASRRSSTDTSTSQVEATQPRSYGSAFSQYQIPLQQPTMPPPPVQALPTPAFTSPYYSGPPASLTTFTPHSHMSMVSSAGFAPFTAATLTPGRSSSSILNIPPPMPGSFLARPSLVPPQSTPPSVSPYPAPSTSAFTTPPQPSTAFSQPPPASQQPHAPPLLSLESLFPEKNALTADDRAHIERFLSGDKVNPQPHLGNTRQFVVHEEQKNESATRPDGSVQNASILESLIFEINYETGTWRKVRKRRRV